MPTATRQRNDVRQYHDLAGQWWLPDGQFAMLHWLARSRAALIPPPARPDAVLVDLGCGGGLLAPHVSGYRHIGIDLVESALGHAAAHGVVPVRADVARLPLADGCADVVSAGEILEHITDLSTVVAEACRVLRPGGTLVLDTLADTALAKFVAVTLAERYGGAPGPARSGPVRQPAPAGRTVRAPRRRAAAARRPAGGVVAGPLAVPSPWGGTHRAESIDRDPVPGPRGQGPMSERSERIINSVACECIAERSEAIA